MKSQLVRSLGQFYCEILMFRLHLEPLSKSLQRVVVAAFYRRDRLLIIIFINIPKWPMKSLIGLPPSTHSLKKIQIRCIFYSVGTKEKKNLKTKNKKGLLHKNISPSQLTCRWRALRMAECVIRSDGRVVYKRCPIKCKARARVGRNRLLCIGYTQKLFAYFNQLQKVPPKKGFTTI